MRVVPLAFAISIPVAAFALYACAGATCEEGGTVACSVESGAAADAAVASESGLDALRDASRAADAGDAASPY